LYRSYPPQPDLPRAYHLLPSAAAKAQKEKIAGSESTAGNQATGERVQANDSSGSSVELSDDAQLIPQPRWEMRKRKASTADLAG
jgi:hypothetical protein